MRSFQGIRGLLLCWVLAATVAQAQQINLNLQEAQLPELLKILSEASGKTFVPTEAAAAIKVSILTPGPVSLEEAFQIVESVLRIRGFASVEDRGIVRIVPLADVKSEATRTFLDPNLMRVVGDQFVTQVIFLKHASAEQLINILRPLVSVNGLVVAEPSSNAVLVTDTADNVRRFLRIVAALDVEGSQRQLEVFFLKHAGAETLARSLSTVLERETRTDLTSAGGVSGMAPSSPSIGMGGTQRPALAIVPDARTNALIAFGTAEQLAVLRGLLDRLDVPGTVERATLHVYALKHANAKDLAEILTAQVKAVAQNTGETTAAAAPATADVKTTQVVGQFESKVSVTADPSTNSLVIAATPEDYSALSAVIDKLDARRTQVFIEGLILEATTGAAQKIGVELRFPTDPNSLDLEPIGGTTFPVGNDGSVLGTVTNNPLAPPGGLVVGAIDGTIELNGREFLNLAGLARALQADNAFNVLSAPHMMTLDNQEAELIVGQERPFLRSQQSTDVGTLVSTFDFKDIGIKLKVTPHIGVGSTVRLDLFVEITNFVSEAQNTVGAVTTTKRSVSSAVLVDSGQMAVIGGLMQEENNRAASRVPCLGSIPALGWIFKSTARERRKTNLLIFLEPKIIEDQQGLEDVRTKKAGEFEEEKPRDRSLREEVKDVLEQMESKSQE